MNNATTTNQTYDPILHHRNDIFIKKSTLKGFILGAIVGGTIVACIKDDSNSVKEIASTVTKIATSYYGCKLIYKIFS